VLCQCTTVAKLFGLSAAEARHFCSHSLQLLLGTGVKLLRCLPAELGLHPPGVQADAARYLAELLSNQAAAVWNTLHVAGDTGWFGAPAAVADWCPPAKLAGWLMAAAQVLQALEPLRRDTGTCLHSQSVCPTIA